MILTDERRQAILDEVVATNEPRRQREFEFTRREYQEYTGVTLANAKWALDRMMQDGTLLREKAFVDGHWPWVYWRPEDE